MNLMTPTLLAQLNQLIANDEVAKFYQWKQWRFLRSRVRKKYNNECQRCKGLGKQSKSDMVHHEKSVRDYPELALSFDNCKPLCNPCHNLEHPEKFGKVKKVKKFMNEERW